MRRKAVHLTMWLIAAITGAGIIAATWCGYQLIGKPFPGFLATWDGTIHQHTMPYWSAYGARLSWPQKIVEVDGVKFTRSDDLRRYVESKPVGTKIEYTLFQGTGKGFRKFTAETMMFSLRDFLLTYGLNLISGSVFLVCGVLLFVLRPDSPFSYGFFFAGIFVPYFCCIHLIMYDFISTDFARLHYFFDQFTIVTCGAYCFILGLTMFEEPKFFKGKPWRYLIFYGVSLIIALAVRFGIRSGNYDLQYFSFNYIHLTYSAMGLSYVFYNVVKTRYSSMIPQIRQRARLMLLGMSFGAIAGAFAALSLLFQTTISYSFLILPACFIPLTMAYGALRSNLFEVDILVKRTVIYSGVLIITAFFYAALFWMFQALFSRFEFYNNYYYQIAFLVFFIILLSRIKHIIQSGIDRAFFRTKVDYEKVMEDVQDKLSVITDAKKIYEAIRDVTVENLFLSDVDILLADGEGNFHSVEKKNVLKKEDDLCKLIMEKNQLISKSDILNDPKLRPVRNRCLAKLAYLESVFLLPINFKDEMMGIMALGERKSGDITFNLQDIEVLHFLSVQASTAFENARLYEKAEEAKKEIEKMNEILEEKVRIRTAELNARAKELEESNAHIAFITHNKSAFLASMSHELRTPLNGIIGFSDMAVEGVYGQINPVAKDVLKDLAFNGRELLQLINDILDLSKIEAGKMDILMDDFSPRDAVDVALGAWMNECEKKGIKVETEFAPDLPMGWGEGKRVKQVLDTLLRNAVRWSQTKAITIRVACKDKNLVFEVEDYGVGIEAYRMPKLFVEHEYPQILDLQYYKNVGLGLALSKKWAELHGGTMWAESAEEKGSKFSFTIQIK